MIIGLLAVLVIGAVGYVGLNGDPIDRAKTVIPTSG